MQKLAEVLAFVSNVVETANTETTIGRTGNLKVVLCS